MNSTTRTFFGAAAGLVALVTPLLIAPAGAVEPAEKKEETEKKEAEEQALIATLESDASLFEKAKACQRLAVVGSKEAVPALAALLDDEELAHYARFGLEPIQDPAVDEALREAMGKLEGELLIGVINSIGARRDGQALRSLAPRLRDPDTPAPVAAAAATAIARIGTPRAARRLERALSNAGESLILDVAHAALRCAEILDASGKHERAVALFDAVRNEKKAPEHVRLAALRSAILSRGEDGRALLVETLRAKDGATFDMGLVAARELSGKEVTQALVSELEKLEPERRALLIGALADRRDPAALPAVIEQAKGAGAFAVRLAALRALGNFGDAYAVPVLLEAAALQDAKLAEAARESLARLPGAEIDHAIVGAFERSDERLRPVLIDLVGRRQISEAVPALRKAAAEDDESIRFAALTALGETVRIDDLSVLTARVIDAGSEKEAAVAREALSAACARMPDRAACVRKLDGALERAPREGKVLLLDVFIAVGGSEALAAVAERARAEDEQVRDAAVEVLSRWKSEEAAGVLLDLARSAESATERRRALRGFRHLIRTLGFPKERRIARCEEAMEVARGEEREIVIEALAGVPATETLAVLERYLEDPELVDPASAAAVTISERIVRSHQDAVARTMKKVIEATEDEELGRKARRLLRQAEGKR